MLDFKKRMAEVLTENILPYWMDKVADPKGGYYGRIDGSEQVHPEAERGAVMNARILWSFSCAYRVLHRQEYLDAAKRAKDYIEAHFLDPDHGGLYWSVDCQGNPLDTKKQTYAMGFAVYGFSEYARATKDPEALRTALELYDAIEAHAFDRRNNGYIEALTRDWQPIADMRLSDKDENGSRTMNTHLHVIEPYTNLLRCLKELGFAELAGRAAQVEKSVRNLIFIFTERLLNKETNHLDLFFNDEWEGRRDIESFGHDIEASWLLHETSLVLGDKDVLAAMEPIVKDIAVAADEGLRPEGAMIYEHWKPAEDGTEERGEERYDLQRQWWVQCECVIGHVNLYQHFGDKAALQIAERCWHFIEQNLLDKEHGEWFWAMLDDGSVDHEGDKAGFWKCPYHNSRMCLELIERDF